MVNILSAALCPGCGGNNNCARSEHDNTAPCWCLSRPAVLPLPVDTSARCYCATCLERLSRNAAESTVVQHAG